MQIFLEKNYKILVLVFFIAYLLIGITVYKDYGAPTDSSSERMRGILTTEYMLHGNKGLFLLKGKYQAGPAFELLLVAIEKKLHFSENPRKIFLMRHALIFSLFYLSVFILYLLVKHRFQSWKMGILGSLFLIISPRIFADSFYNTKDIVFLSLFTIGIYTLIKYLENKTIKNTIIHAAVCAVLVAVRINGLLLPVLTLILWGMDFIFPKTTKTNGISRYHNTLITAIFTGILTAFCFSLVKFRHLIKLYPIEAHLLFLAISLLIFLLLSISMQEKQTKKMIWNLQYFISMLIILIIACWPYLWPNPLFNFIDAFINAKHYMWPKTVLYMGQYIRASQLPWHYTPVWILITTPLLYSALFFIGCLVTLKSLVLDMKNFLISRRNDLIFASWFFLPLVWVITMRSVLYDAWRHLFFIYPAFIILALIGLKSLFQYIILKLRNPRRAIIQAILIILIAGSLSKVLLFMIINHPYQNVYFNRLAGKNMEEIKTSFELDYWGLSYKQALEYILKNDLRNKIRISVPISALQILPPNDLYRVIPVKSNMKADYYLNNYRWHKDEYDPKNEYYAIKVGGTKIMAVYKDAPPQNYPLRK